MKFSKVNIEISNICNLQCSFCPEVIRDKKLMDLHLFEKIIEQVSPITELVCLHLMGDPLVHPKLTEMIDICEKYQTKIFFVTNGVLLRDDKMNELIRPPLQQVNFSLHSFNDNFPNQDSSKYLEKIFSFTELAFEQRPDLYLNYRLWNLNDPLGSKTDNSIMLQKICDQFEIPTPSSIDVRKRKSIHLKNRLYLHFDTEFTWPSLDLEVLGTQGRCHGLTSHFGILVDGTAVPCCLDKEGSIRLGNINEQPVLDILNSERARQMMTGFKERRLIEQLCQRCQYIERFN